MFFGPEIVTPKVVEVSTLILIEEPIEYTKFGRSFSESFIIFDGHILQCNR